MLRRWGLAMIVAAALPSGAWAQGAEVRFGAADHDTSQPVEIAAETLDLDQAAGTAVFAGGVLAAQGALRLAADRVEVFYAAEAGRVARLVATGGVTVTNGAEAAEARDATFEVAQGLIVMEGDVLLTQGPNALASQRLRIDLNAGTGVLEGRVQTVITPGSRP